MAEVIRVEGSISRYLGDNPDPLPNQPDTSKKIDTEIQQQKINDLNNAAEIKIPDVGSMLPLPCSIGGLLGGLLGDIQGIINGVLGTIGNMVNTVSNFISNIGNMINNILSLPSRILEGIQTAIDNLLKKAKDIIIRQIECVSNLVSSFLNAPAALAQGIEVSVGGLWDSVSTIGDKIADLAYGPNAIGKQLLDQVAGIQESLDKAFQGTIGSIASSFESTLGDAISGIGGGLTTGLGVIKSVATKVIAVKAVGAVVGAIV